MHIDAYRHAEQHIAAQESADNAYTAAHQCLMQDAVEAFAKGGAHTVAGMTTRFAFADWLAGPDPRTDDVIRALQACADGKPEGRMQAMAVIDSFARDLADSYAEVA